MPKTPTRNATRRRGDAAILRDARAATGRTQAEFAALIGQSLSGYGKWENGAPVEGAIVRLCWLIKQHPELADEIADAFEG